MAWAIPCAVGFIPPDDAAHMAADRRECMHDSLFVPEGSHAFDVDLQDRRLAATNRVERFRLWLYMPASARSRGARSLLRRFRAGGRLDAGYVEHFKPAVFFTHCEVGQD